MHSAGRSTLQSLVTRFNGLPQEFCTQKLKLPSIQMQQGQGQKLGPHFSSANLPFMKSGPLYSTPKLNISNRLEISWLLQKEKSKRGFEVPCKAKRMVNEANMNARLKMEHSLLICVKGCRLLWRSVRVRCPICRPWLG